MVPPASRLVWALARISIRMPAGSGHGVVLGSGNNESSEFVGMLGGGFRRRARIGARRRSTTYSEVSLGGYFV